MKLIETPSTAQSASSASMTPTKTDTAAAPLNLTPAYMFYIKLGNIEVAMFTECSGLSAKRAFEPVKEGGVNDHVHMLPGTIEYSNVVLKRGVSLSTALWDWFQTGQFDFAVSRQDITIYQFSPEADVSRGAASAGDQSGAIKTWSLSQAFPVSWKLGDMNSATSGLVVESLEIAHEGLSLIAS
jgi:phage tail-like protein